MTDFTPDYDNILKDVPTGLLLGGEFRPASNSETFDVINPATDKPLVKVAFHSFWAATASSSTC